MSFIVGYNHNPITINIPIVNIFFLCCVSRLYVSFMLFNHTFNSFVVVPAEQDHTSKRATHGGKFNEEKPAFTL